MNAFRRARLAMALVGWGVAASADPGVLPARGESAARGPALTIPLRIVADSQIHEFHGAPTFAGSSIVDKFIEVTIRTSQQRLFGSELLAHSITANRDGSELATVLHLGDAMDVSCSSEWDTFRAVMDASGRPWVLAPGNHDGFFTGNVLPPLDKKSSNVGSKEYGSEGWNLRCRYIPLSPGSREFTKSDLIPAYLGALQVKDIEMSSTPTMNCQVWAEGRLPLLRFTTCMSKNPEEKWKSFLLQELDVSNPACRQGANPCRPVRLVLLDTSQYSKQPVFTSGAAGTHASVLGEQWDEVDHWIVENAKPGADTIFAGHHPLTRFDPASRKSLLSRACKQRIPMYVSAHTHEGFWKQWRCPGSKRILVELNIGSVLDWPTHYRVLTLFNEGDDKVRLVATYDELPTQADQCKSPDKDNWYPAAQSNRAPANQILSFSPVGPVAQGRRALLSGLAAELREFKELLLKFSSTSPPGLGELDDATALSRIDEELKNLAASHPSESRARVDAEVLLESLERFEAKRSVADDNLRRTYKRCLAGWAAEEDFKRVNKTKGNRGAERDGSRTITEFSVSTSIVR